MPTYGTTGSSTAVCIDFDINYEDDATRFTRLANLLFPSTISGSTLGVST